MALSAGSVVITQAPFTGAYLVTKSGLAGAIFDLRVAAFDPPYVWPIAGVTAQPYNQEHEARVKDSAMAIPQYERSGAVAPTDAM